MKSGIEGKANAIFTTLDYLNIRYGKERTASVLSHLASENREAIENAILSSWLPIEVVGDLLNGIKTEFGGELGAEANFVIGLEAAKISYSTVYKIMFRLGNPGFIIRRAAGLYSTFLSQGTLDVVESEKGRLRLQLSDFSYINQEYCAQRLRGFMQATLELSGCTITESSHPVCRSDGAEHCEFLYTWQT